MKKGKRKQSREYARAYYWSHVEKVRAYHREWNRAHRDTIYPKQNAAKRKERRENPDKVHARERAYWRKPENAARKRQAMKKYRASAKGRAWRMAWNAKNADRVKATNRRSEAKRKVKKQTDAAYYAKRRADTRKLHAKAAMIAKGSYRPRYSARIPDWCVMGGAVDVRSRFLFENATASDRAFARDLAIERRAQ